MNILENIVKPSLIVLMLWLKLQILLKTFVHHETLQLLNNIQRPNQHTVARYEICTNIIYLSNSCLFPLSVVTVMTMPRL